MHRAGLITSFLFLMHLKDVKMPIWIMNCKFEIIKVMSNYFIYKLIKLYHQIILLHLNLNSLKV